MELLAPAGDMERLESAIAFGADAVYLAGTEFGMRAAPSNFTMEQLETAVQMAHSKGVRVHMTCNTLPRGEELDRLPALLRHAQDIGIDAFIAADLGVMALAKQHAPKVDLHVSTQAGVVNHETANVFYNMGAARVVLARELSLEEIAALRAKTPKELEIEAFVHGSMCVSFSGRCLLSNYMTGRDANRGDCAQPCRWKYHLVEEKRPGEYYPVVEDEQGTYIMNSRDLCMIHHVPELIKAGISSMKIEGRAKSAYYVAVTTNAYRHAIDAYEKAPDAPLPAWIPEELNKISHREYSTGFYFTQPGQVYQNGGYVRDYDVVAICEDWQNGVARLSQRNRFFRGDVVDVLEPGSVPYLLQLDDIQDADGLAIEAAPHATMTVFAKTDRPVAPGALLRKARK